ncbi:MAG: FHA domain-containing protein [Pseudomonadota bacterium]
MADYLKDYQEELRRVGDVVFKQRHKAPVLIVVGKAAELVDDKDALDRTMAAKRSEDSGKQVALLNRVFPVSKAAHTPRGPVRLGRSGDNDIPIPEYSISKQQCAFDFEPEGVMITDCGSTNGTLVDDARIDSKEQVLIKDGTRISLGRFAFVFRSAAGFHAHVKSLPR